ncbi:hypothetical protein [Actinokineospora sp. HUAS TT18]|uniref:hypothetical protein n=1 Tax=Actinokineospora sp. HUAS TT18 TaxID=3447451 RepID=UPI003F51E7A7
MNEHDLRDALGATMAATAAPPSMNGSVVLDAARRAERKRKATFAGLGAAGAVAVITAGAVLLPGLGGTDSDTIAIGAPSRTTTTSPSKTETSWPNGQPDRTATAGPRYDKAVELLDLLKDALPNGFPTGDTRHQAQFDQYIGHREAWEYDAYIAGATASVMVTVLTPGNSRPEDPCAGEPMLVCEPLIVDSEKVWIVSRVADGNQFDATKGAFYRHTDGTVVEVVQSGTGQLPLTQQELARLAMSPRFHLS